MLLILLKTSGWLLARAPEVVLRGLAAVLGEAALLLAPARRRLIHSNLHHAYPDKPPEWRRRIARLASRRLVETGMLSLAAPYLSEKRIRRIARLGPSLTEWITTTPGGGSAVLATLHLALWESQTWLKLMSPVPLPDYGIIFRPLDNPKADAYIKRTRERHGMRLLSRREGFADALAILRGGGCVGILFDQNAGFQGTLTTLLGRVCSTTELPGLLAAKLGVPVRTFFPRRTGFWRVIFESEPVAYDGTVKGATVALNRWLESALADEDLCASWLWVHDRWRHQDVPSRRLRLESRRDFLRYELQSRGLAALPRKTRVVVRMPNWLGDIVMALPLLRALRLSRPDAEIILAARPHFLPLLEGLRIADRFKPLPPRGAGYFAHFWRCRRAYPDVWLLFTNSLRGDLEAWLAGAPQRFGIARPGRRRPLLTHPFDVPVDFDETRRHQLELWEGFFRHFGLEGGLDRTPFAWNAPGPPPPNAGSAPIGLIPGSENEPAKRWPVAHWRRLIEAFPDRRFAIFGTKGDAGIASEVAGGFPSERVENLAGKTDLAAFADRLSTCCLLVSNDTGGMHLANALGVPVVALFGPTNPKRTAPVFDAPVLVLQPPGCPPEGGSPLSGLAPESVIDAVAKRAGALKS